MNGLVCSGDAMPLTVTVSTSSTPIINTVGDPSLHTDAKYLRISNMSNNYVFLAVNNDAVVDSGLALAPKGTPGWFVEFNNDNMIYGEFRGISTGSAQLAILVGG